MMAQEPSFIERFAAQHEALKASLPGAGRRWLEAMRERGLAGFAAQGLPTPRLEAWKFTNLNPLAKIAFAPAAPTTNGVRGSGLPWLLPAGTAAHRLVFVNGRLRADLSDPGALPPGAVLASLAERLESGDAALESKLGAMAIPEQSALLALNTAFLTDGFVLRLAPGVAVERPIELLFVALPGSEPLAYHPRGLVVAEAGSRAVLVERHVALGGGTYLANAATEIALGEGAALAHCKALDEGAQGFHLATSDVRLAAGARYDSFVLTAGGRLSRDEIHVTLDGPEASCRLNGAYMGRGRQHIDNTTSIDHATPRTTSREIYKGALDDYARGVFQGRILVRPDAQKTDGQQTSRALLLSDGAEIDAKPQLEIYADDVKCSHGAAAGELEEDALFYLRSRGIPEMRARHMLVEAFLNDAVDTIEDGIVREACRQVVAGWVTAKPAEAAP